MSVFNFETQMADLQNRYAQENAAQDFGRFLGQQRFGRQRQDMNQDWVRQFPRATGQWARRGLGANVRSGLMTEDITNRSNDFARSLAELDADEATEEAQFFGQRSTRDAAYQRSLLALQEQLARERANQNPFPAYGG